MHFWRLLPTSSISSPSDSNFEIGKPNTEIRGKCPKHYSASVWSDQQLPIFFHITTRMTGIIQGLHLGHELETLLLDLGLGSSDGSLETN